MIKSLQHASFILNPMITLGDNWRRRFCFLFLLKPWIMLFVKFEWGQFFSPLYSLCSLAFLWKSVACVPARPWTENTILLSIIHMLQRMIWSWVRAAVTVTERRIFPLLSWIGWCWCNTAWPCLPSSMTDQAWELFDSCQNSVCFEFCPF